MIRTQLTKTDTLAFRCGRPHITDLPLARGDHDTVDEQLHPLPFLLKAGLGQSLAGAATEIFQTQGQMRHLGLTVHLCFQLSLLSEQDLPPLLAVAPPAPVFFPPYNTVPVGFRQPL
jgi:hypothetical protein